MRRLHHAIQISNQTFGIAVAEHDIARIRDDVHHLASTPNISRSRRSKSEFHIRIRSTVGCGNYEYSGEERNVTASETPDLNTIRTNNVAKAVENSDSYPAHYRDQKKSEHAQNANPVAGKPKTDQRAGNDEQQLQQ